MALAISTFSSGGTGTNGRIKTTTTAGTPISITGFQSPAVGDTFWLFFWSIADTPTFIGTPTVKLGTSTATQIGTTLNFDSGATSLLTFGLVNPPTGSQNLSVSWTGGAGGDAYSVLGISFSGSISSSVAAATYGYQGNDNTSTNTTTTATTSVSVTTGDIAVCYHVAAANTTFSSVSGTEIDIDNSAASADSWVSASNNATGAGSTITLTGTLTGAALWGSAIVAVKAASGDTLNLAMQTFFM